MNGVKKIEAGRIALQKTMPKVGDFAGGKAVMRNGVTVNKIEHQIGDGKGRTNTVMTAANLFSHGAPNQVQPNKRRSRQGGRLPMQ